MNESIQQNIILIVSIYSDLRVPREGSCREVPKIYSWSNDRSEKKIYGVELRYLSLIKLVIIQYNIEVGRLMRNI